MPILQTRLHRLIQAAEVYLQRDMRLRDYVSRTISFVNAGKITAIDAINAIDGQLKATRDYDPAERVISEERMRYNFNHARNVKEAAKMRRRRALAKGDLAAARQAYHEEPLDIESMSPSEQEQWAERERNDAEEFNRAAMEFFSQDALPNPDEGLTPEQIAAKEAILAERRAARAAKASKEAPKDEE